MKKGAQFEMSFGMIFSILLIIAFIIVAFIAINSFLGLRCSAEQGLFIKDLQNKINLIWRVGGADDLFESKINGCNIDYVCFWDPERFGKGRFVSFLEASENGFIDFDGEKGKHNLYFYPRRESNIASSLLNHININSSAMPDNPTCYREEEGIFTIPLKKNLNEDSIRIS